MKWSNSEPQLVVLSLLPRAVGRFSTLAILGLLFVQWSSAALATPFLYATGRNDALVNSVDAAGSFTLLKAGSPMINVEGVALDADGNIYVADSPNNSGDKIVRITPAGVATTFAAFNQHVSPTGLVFDTAGNLYVSGQADDSIRKITPSGTISTFSISNLLSRPFGMAFDASGDLYVANHGNNTVVKVSPAGTQTLFSNGPFNNPNDVAFNTSGDLFVSNHSAQRIDRITPNGVISTFFSGAPLAGTTMGLAVDPDNNVYVGTAGNSIVRITPSGSSATVFSTMTNMIANQGGVQFLALSSPAIVPEPSTYAMALAGIACGGFSIWRRRKRSCRPQ
jgi:streptogramin lyase